MTKTMTTNQHSEDEGTALTVPSPKNITVTPIGLVIKGTLSFDDWASLGPVLGKYHKGIAWAVGDWLATGEYKFGEMYGQALDTTGLSLGRLRNLKSLADRVPMENRAGSLSLSHHEAVAPFSHDMQRKLIAMAIEQGLDRDELRKVVAELNAALPEGEEKEDGEQEVIDPPKQIPHKPLVDAAKRVVKYAGSLRGYEMTADTSFFFDAVYELEELLGEDNGDSSSTDE